MGGKKGENGNAFVILMCSLMYCSFTEWLVFWELRTNRSHLVNHLQVMNGHSLYFIDENVNKFLYNKVTLVVCGLYTWNKTFYSDFVSTWNKNFWNKIAECTYKKSICVGTGDCSETEGNSEIGGSNVLLA